MPAGVGVAKGTILGTCEDMCPHAEIVKRCNIEDVPLFERADPRVATTTSELAVKKFSRNVSLLHWLSGLASECLKETSAWQACSEMDIAKVLGGTFSNAMCGVWKGTHPA